MFVRRNGYSSDRNPAFRLCRERVVRQAPALAEQGGVGDHGRVVPGVDQRDQAEVDAAALGPGGELAAQQAVGGGAAGDGEQREGLPLVEALQAVEHLAHGGLAKGGEEVEHGLRRLAALSEVNPEVNPEVTPEVDRSQN